MSRLIHNAGFDMYMQDYSSINQQHEHTHTGMLEQPQTHKQPLAQQLYSQLIKPSSQQLWLISWV